MDWRRKRITPNATPSCWYAKAPIIGWDAATIEATRSAILGSLGIIADRMRVSGIVRSPVQFACLLPPDRYAIRRN
jgi:hypothetical protein